MSVLLLFFLITIVCLLFDLPIVIAMGVSTLILIFLEPNFPMDVITQTMFSAADSFPLLAIPFFILAGEIMSAGGMAKRIISFIQKLVGSVTGSVGMITVLASALFAAITGSGPATVAIIGGIMIPYMIKNGYDPKYAATLSASSGSLGPIIPPSIIFIVYGVVANVSIGDMFIAGIIPGTLIVIALLIFNFIISKREGYSQQLNRNESSDTSFWKELNQAKWALLTPVLILGSIYGGIVTPTEAAILAVVFTTIICVFVYREINWKDYFNILIKTVATSGGIMIFVGFATLFGKYLSLKQIPQTLAMQISELTTNPIVILLILNVFLLIIGMFMETIAAILIFVPLLLPIVTAIGVDPIHFGIVVCINLAIGMITPPFGINLFVASKVAGIGFEQTLRYLKWAFATLIVVLLFITLIPQLSLYLVELSK
ncbi:TRAP transporter large permease [Oceanobacillus sp. CF4.6]|uniref:TRAP transporter large permease n=1 Tax=Oceanobacillus sp. CF4.6 TaxID=3373080 RepID=UPI003EE669BA